MAVVGKIYGNVFLAAFNKEIDWLDDVINVMLTTSTYVPDQDVHDYKNDVTNEVTGAGYTANGAALGSKTITYTAATNIVKLAAAATVWSAATITARNAVVYDFQTGVATTSPLICYQASDVDISSTAGNWSIVWHADGICQITVA